MRRSLALIIALAAISAACGGHSSAPTAPTPAAGGSATTAGMATISGAVQTGAAATPAAFRFGGGAAITGVTVTIVGTTISATADASGRFTLNNVPPGDLQLQFSGGASGTLPLTAVQASQTIDVVVVVNGSSVSLDSEVRSGGGQSELEGRVDALPPTTAALSFKAAGTLVKTDSTTTFKDGSRARTFADLQIGMRVHVKGSPDGDAIKATSVELQNSQTQIPVEVNGIVSALSGSASAFQFTVNGTLLKGDTSTTFFGDGDRTDAFADLKNGLRVEVKGQQQNGFVYAVSIHINAPDAPTTPPEDTSASIEGILKTIGGAPPSLSLTVDSTKVQTSSSTTVKRRGDVQTLAALAVGQTLHVIGTRRSDGSIDAREIDIDNDAPGGEFEIEGSVGGVKGTCPSLTFAVNGFSITTNASTIFDGAACSAFKNGDKVQVKGTKQADGSVLATHVKRE